MSKNDIDLTGRVAKQWHEEIAKATKKSRDYNKVRRDRTEKLRRALTRVWAALEKGETVNGINSKEAWARWFNDTVRTKNPIRQIQKIIAGPKPKEANSVRVITIKPNEIVRFKLACGAHDDEPGEVITFDLERGINENYRNGSWTAKLELKENVAARKTQPAKKQAATQTQTPKQLNKIARVPRTHRYKPSTDQTWCGKKPAESRSLKLAVGEKPTCKACQQQEFMAGMRNEEPTIVIQVKEECPAAITNPAPLEELEQL